MGGIGFMPCMTFRRLRCRMGCGSSAGVGRYLRRRLPDSQNRSAQAEGPCKYGDLHCALRFLVQWDSDVRNELKRGI